MNLQRNYDLWNAEEKISLTQIRLFHKAKELKAETIILEEKSGRASVRTK